MFLSGQHPSEYPLIFERIGSKIVDNVVLLYFNPRPDIRLPALEGIKLLGSGIQREAKDKNRGDRRAIQISHSDWKKVEDCIKSQDEKGMFLIINLSSLLT